LLQHRRWRLRRPGGGASEPQSDASDTAPLLQVLQAQWDGHVLRAALEGISDRDAAEGLRGCEILIERAALPAPPEHEYYREDLLGFTVRNVEGVVLGSVQYFLGLPGSAVMVVQGEREYAVPAAPPHLRRVDLAQREIEVDWPADF
jgi:16S rRNA processing protein RimM